MFRAGAVDRIALKGASHYGGEYAPVSVKKSDDLVLITGFPRVATWGAIGTVAGDLRPVGRHVFNCSLHDKRGRADVLGNGNVEFVDGPHENDWFGLNFLYAKKGAPLTLLNGWANYGGEYAGAYVADEDGLNVLGGLVRSGKWEAIAKLPEKNRPKARLVFCAPHHMNHVRVDVLPDGNVSYVFGKQNDSWVSLAGLCWSNLPAYPLALANGWTSYGGDYAPATARLCGKFVVLSGLIRAGTSKVLGKVPPELAPTQRLVFHTGGWYAGDFISLRVDVLPDGTIQLITGPDSGLEWITLDGVVC